MALASWVVKRQLMVVAALVALCLAGADVPLQGVFIGGSVS